MANGDTDVSEDKTLQYLITHIFCPLQLPQEDDHSLDNDRALSNTVSSAAYAYSQHTSDSANAQWRHIEKMLRNLNHAMSLSVLDEALLDCQIKSMEVGGTNCVAFIISSHAHYTQMSWCI